ncbi:hypothetical protein CBW65_13955 [Tumebacillus avium]|uniref:HNH nuclease domain-containing protein n=2 Tax=Tumebacillus avium TaxID=1903704 RepID=A0A1Y0ITQ0_9BACL|nr:hypothetical protein CBW65_13955 [Tumebacillus avium]
MPTSINYWNIPFPESVKHEAKIRDDYACQICYNDLDLEVHHIVPRQFGGSHNEDNLITLCSSCHRAVETRNERHAIRICTKNALRHAGITPQRFRKRLDLFEKSVVMHKLLIRVFEKISASDIADREDLLIEISEILES